METFKLSLNSRLKSQLPREIDVLEKKAEKSVFGQSTKNEDFVKQIQKTFFYKFVQFSENALNFIYIFDSFEITPTWCNIMFVFILGS